MRGALPAALVVALLLAPATLAAGKRGANLAAGIAAMARGDQVVARRELERAMVANPRDPASYYRLGLLYAGQGDDDKALKYLRLSLQLEPAHRGALLAQGQAWLRQGERARAVRNLDRLVGACGDCREAAALRRALR